jgi:SAM-dependent methyltransferase
LRPADYWKGNVNLQHITPPGEDMPEVDLFAALRVACRGTVFEFGCGYGRLAPCFRPDMYTGMDINPSALVAAKDRNPGHVFVEDWAEADTVLAHTVLLHIPDDEIQSVIDRMKGYKRIVIGEIMGRSWRRGGNPPVFNREVSDYADMVGVSPSVTKVAYPRYGVDLDLLVFDL